MNQAVGLRETNKQLRRERILEAARDIIRSRGYEALNIRELAEAAGVTAPTIYNLIGNKTEILRCLAEDIEIELARLHEQSTALDPIAKIEEVVHWVRVSCGRDERFSRELFRALDGQEAGPSRISVLHAGLWVAIEDCQRALDQRLLRGTITPEVLGRELASRVDQAQHLWLRGVCTLDEMERQALIGCCVTLAADATPALHERLVAKIRALQRAGARRNARRRPD
jgi:AcrR family transcriptional regulator